MAIEVQESGGPPPGVLGVTSPVEAPLAAPRPRDRLRPVLAFALLLLCFGTFGALLWLSADREKLILIMFGVVAGYLSAVVQFYFGSSQGSLDKQRQTENLMQRLTGKP